MECSNKTPDYKLLIYQYNPDNGYYDLKEKPISFSKLPINLKVEETQNKKIIKSDHIIRGRVKDSRFTFFTGLQKTIYRDWYFGDLKEEVRGKTKKSFILFHFSPDKLVLRVYFFNHFYLYPKLRGNFISLFLLDLDVKKTGVKTPVNVQIKTDR